MRLSYSVMLGAIVALSVSRASAAERTVSFRVSAVCTCAECSFEAKSKLPKLTGVKKTALSVRDRRLDVTIDDAKCPVSSLADAVGRLDMGKGSVMLWPAPSAAEATRLASGIAATPGIKTARADGKMVLVSFTLRKPVTFAQIDAAAKGVPSATS